MSAFTYKEWLSKGRQVQRGQKAVRFNDHGEAVFNESQTKMLTNKTNQNFCSGRYYNDCTGDGMSDSDRDFDSEFSYLAWGDHE
jgi:hypothetical protein